MQGSFLLLLFCWSLIATLPAALEPWLGAGNAILLTFVAVALMAAIAHPRPIGRSPLRSLSLVLLGGVAGFASYPAWVGTIAAIGFALELPLIGTEPWPGGPALWAAAVLAAPIFEELLYRDRLLPELRRRVGAAPALLATSLLFAVAHLEPWFALITFLLGLALGATRLLAGSVAICLGLHAGLNAAAIACGVPPVRPVLSLPTAALTGVATLFGAIALARRWPAREGASAASIGAATAEP